MIYNKVILVIAISQLLSLHQHKFQKLLKIYSIIILKLMDLDSIKLSLIIEESCLKLLLMIMYQYLNLLIDLYFVKLMVNKYGLCYQKKHGLKLKVHMEIYHLEHLIKFLILFAQLHHSIISFMLQVLMIKKMLFGNNC